MKRKLSKREAVTQSINHWKRMITWVEKNEKDERASALNMEADLGEDWYAEYCPLCKRFFYNVDVGEECIKCPLAQKYESCDSKKSVWRKVYSSKTWKSWLKNAKVMLKHLESLLEE